MTKNEHNFYAYGVIATVDYIKDKDNAKRILAKFNLTPKKIKSLHKWMQNLLNGKEDATK